MAERDAAPACFTINRGDRTAPAQPNRRRRAKHKALRGRRCWLTIIGSSLPSALMSLIPGSPAPDFTVPATRLGRFSPRDALGRWLALYFYPKDDTPGCTQEALSFHEAAAAFTEAGAMVVGVSRDTIASHERFAAKHDIGFPLCADVEGVACESYAVWVEKRLYGRTYMGVERATFLVNPQGRIHRIWRRVKVSGHAAAVLSAISTG